MKKSLIFCIVLLGLVSNLNALCDGVSFQYGTDGNCSACPTNCNSCNSANTCDACSASGTKNRLYVNGSCQSCTEIHTVCNECTSSSCTKRCPEGYDYEDGVCDKHNWWDKIPTFWKWFVPLAILGTLCCCCLSSLGCFAPKRKARTLYQPQPIVHQQPQVIHHQTQIIRQQPQIIQQKVHTVRQVVPTQQVRYVQSPLRSSQLVSSSVGSPMRIINNSRRF